MSVNGTAKEIFLLEITENRDFDIKKNLLKKLRKTYVLTKKVTFLIQFRILLII